MGYKKGKQKQTQGQSTGAISWTKTPVPNVSPGDRQRAVLSIIHTLAFVHVVNCENVLMNKGQRVDMSDERPPLTKKCLFQQRRQPEGE